jgi:hypothetical protein
MGRFPASLGEKGVDGGFGFTPDQPSRQSLRLGDHFSNGSDADLAAIELHYDIAATFKTDRLAKLRRYAQTSRFGDAPTRGSHGIFPELTSA